MSGNALEEGLFRQIGNPSHTDPARAGFLAGAVAGFGVAAAGSYVFPLSSFWFIVVWMSAGAAVTAIILTMVKRRKLAVEAQMLADKRAQHERETKTAIDEMNRALQR